MLEKIKNFVQNLTPTTWILVGVGVFAFVLLTWLSSHSTVTVVVPPAK